MVWHSDTHSVSSPSPCPPLFVTLYFPGATSPVPALIDHSYPVSLVNEKLLNKLPCLRELNVYPPAHSSPIYPLGCIITASHFLDPAFPVSCEFRIASDIEPLVILGNDYLSRLASLYDFHIDNVSGISLSSLLYDFVSGLSFSSVHISFLHPSLVSFYDPFSDCHPSNYQKTFVDIPAEQITTFPEPCCNTPILSPTDHVSTEINTSSLPTDAHLPNDTTSSKHPIHAPMSLDPVVGTVLSKPLSAIESILRIPLLFLQDVSRLARTPTLYPPYPASQLSSTPVTLHSNIHCPSLPHGPGPPFIPYYHKEKATTG